MSRWGYFAKRLVLSVPVLFLVISFLFLMLRLGPLDPVAARLGPDATGADAQAMREALGLTKPLWEQFIQFMTELLLFEGQSWVVRPGRDLFDVVAASGPATLWLGSWAILLPLFIGLPLGFYAGLRSNTLSDYIASIGGILWLAMPNFWLAVMTLAFLRRTQGSDFFDWYSLGPDISSITGTPDLEFFSFGDVFGFPLITGVDWGILAQDIKLILPAALILGSASMATELRIGRTAMLETINANYVETARAKGVKSRKIIGKHVFRNALIPLVPVITNEAFLLIGGSVIIETIFNINGLGRVYFQALIQGDLPLAGALLFIFTLLIIFLNIFQDFLFTIIDPRVGYEQ